MSECACVIKSMADRQTLILDCGLRGRERERERKRDGERERDGEGERERESLLWWGILMTACQMLGRPTASLGWDTQTHTPTHTQTRTHALFLEPEHGDA